MLLKSMLLWNLSLVAVHIICSTFLTCFIVEWTFFWLMSLKLLREIQSQTLSQILSQANLLSWSRGDIKEASIRVSSAYSILWIYHHYQFRYVNWKVKYPQFNGKHWENSENVIQKLNKHCGLCRLLKVFKTL